MPNPASVAYAAYCEAMGIKYDFDNLPEKEQKAWFAVAAAVVKMIHDGQDALDHHRE